MYESKKTHIPSCRKSSEHAEEGLIKKINKWFYRKQIKNPISIYSIRINRFGDIKCAKPCRDCMRYIINSKIKIKDIIWIEYDLSGKMSVILRKYQNPKIYIIMVCLLEENFI